MAASESPTPLSKNAVDDDQVAQKVVCLACAFCQFPLAAVGQVLVDRTDCWDAEVYAYPLSILELDEVWCYSATNPSKHRFDVVRTVPTPGVSTQGVPTALHSWFPGYSWNMAACASCGAHLGWGFVKTAHSPPTDAAEQPPTDTTEQPLSDLPTAEQLSSSDDDDDVEWASADAPAVQLDFQGLISTKCCERSFPVDEYERLVAPDRVQQVKDQLTNYQIKRAQCYAVLRRLPDRRLANELGMLLHVMDSQDFALRGMIDSLWLQLAACHQPVSSLSSMA